MTNRTRFELNMARLNDIDSALHSRLLQIESPVTRLTGADGIGELNLDLGHTVFYEPSAGEYVVEQLEAFARAPKRITAHLPPIDHVGTLLADSFYGEFYRALDIRPESLISDAGDRTGGFLILLGVGLGGHIRQLTKSYEVRHVVIVEQMIEFIWHSFHVEDWTVWMNRITDAGGTIRFITSPVADEVPNYLYWHLRQSNLELIAGSLIFKHYSSPYLDTVERLFRERLPLISVSAGFFEDELVMLQNSYRNFAGHDYFLLEPKPRPAVPVPALVVGAGPSIDRAIETIRALSGAAVVISCGTALGVLLRNGIVPDIQCELENVAAVWDHHSLNARTHDLSGIMLVASSTVDPRVASLFGRRIFFFRDSVSSTKLFGNGFVEFSGAAPSVTNLGLRLSRTLGFREIFLFGVDLGARDPDRHHSKDAIYCTDEEWGKAYTRNQERMTIPLPGNFGGTVYTNRVLLWFRMMMADFLLMVPDLTVWNCSDGASIPGTTPRLASQVAPAASVFDKQSWLAGIEFPPPAPSCRHPDRPADDRGCLWPFPRLVP